MTIAAARQQAARKDAEDTNRRTAAKTQATPAQAQPERFAQIGTNTFFKILVSEESRAFTPEERQAQFAVAYTFTGSKEESRQRAKELADFQEYLQDARERMNTEIIRLTDTDAFAQLQAVYEEMNTALIDFDNRMLPLTQIIDAVHTLRTQGLTFEAFKEIQDDRKNEEEYAKEQARLEGQKSEDARLIWQLEQDILRLGEEKGFFGFGGVKETARVAIKQKEKEIAEARTRISGADAGLATLRTKRQNLTSKLGEYSEQKAKLRELLDISGDEHRERQTALVKAALTFVEKSKDRIASVRSHLGGMNDQVERLFDANTHISRIYAVMGEGLNDAEKANQQIRAGLEPPKEGEESLIQRHNREEQRQALDQHMASLSNAKADTISTFADLTGQTIRIKTMLEANTAQVARVRTMQSQGVAGVADRLATVLQAVSQAALGESAAAAKDTLALMMQSTNTVAQNQTIANAMGIKETNQDLIRALDDLGTYGEAVREATAITQEGVSEARQHLEKLRDLAQEVKGDIGKAFAVHAEAALEKTPEAKQPTVGVKSPFGI